MGRRKLPLELIPEEKSRKLTCQRRKKCLLKKAQELSALCGVDTCVVMYDSGSSSSSATAQPETWPANHGEVRRVIERYQNGCFQTRAKRKSGLQEFFERKKRKVESELEKARKDAWDAKYNISDEQLKSLSGDKLRDLLSSLQMKVDAAKARLVYLKEEKENDKNYHGDRTVEAPMWSTMHMHRPPMPSRIPMTSDYFGYQPPPHAYGMQMQQQGLPNQLRGSNLSDGADSRLAYIGQEETHEVGTWKTKCPFSSIVTGGFLAEHNDGAPKPWMSLNLEDEFFLPGLLDDGDLHFPW